MLERKNQGRSRLKLAVFIVVGIHVVGLTVLLMQGCKKEEPVTLTPLAVQDTNPPVTPPFTEPTNPPPSTATGPSTAVIPPSVPPVVSTTAPPVAVPGDARQHTVEKGDSFYTLGKKYGVTTKAIETANPGVDAKKLKVGQKLSIPPASSTPASTSAPGTTAGTTPETGEPVYVVKSGDTLAKIAKRVGTTVKALKSANNLTTDSIKVGQKLKVPAKAAAPAAEPAAPAPASAAPTTSPSAPVAPPGH